MRMRHMGLAVLVVGATASCTHTQSNKFVVPGYAGKANSVAVATFMSSERIAANVAEFRSAMETQLAACGLQSNFVGREAVYRSSFSNSPGPYSDQDAISDVGAAQADAILIVGEKAKHTMTQNFQTQEIGREYQVRYYDVPAKSVVWSTDLYMSGMTTFQVYKPNEKSKRLANEVVTSLAVDGILKNCPPASAK